VSASAAKPSAVPKREESLIEEMRAAIARDREQLGRRSAPALQVPAKEPKPEPEQPPRRSLVARMLRRG